MNLVYLEAGNESDVSRMADVKKLMTGNRL